MHLTCLCFMIGVQLPGSGLSRDTTALELSLPKFMHSMLRACK